MLVGMVTVGTVRAASVAAWCSMRSKRARFVERAQKRREEAESRYVERAKRTPAQQREATARRGQTVGKREEARLAKQESSNA